MRFPKVLRKFLLGYLVLHLLTAGLFVAVLTRVMKDQMIRDAQRRMSGMAQMLKEHIAELDQGMNDPSLTRHLRIIGNHTKVRFTIISDEGTVLADSTTGNQDIGFHGDRPEILMARTEGTGFAQRYSKTLAMRMMYLASTFESEQEKGSWPKGFVRVAIPQQSINSAISALQRYVWLFAIGLSAITALVMVLFSARTMQPLSSFADVARRVGVGEYHRVPDIRQPIDEWRDLSDAFDQMQSELNAREQELLENSHRLQAVLSSMIEGVLAIDSTGTVMLANGAALRMLSFARSDLVGRKLLDIVRIPELQQAVEKTQRHRTYAETEFETSDLQRRVISARVSMLADESDPGVALVLNDVTELRRLETMRRDFVANVSHELKTPLSSIKAYAETLRLGGINDANKCKEFLHQIETQAELLNLQIQDLLQLARVESGKQAFDIGPVAIHKVCADCVQLMKSSADKCKVKLHLKSSDKEPLAKADGNGVRTIVTNLISNAIHYTPEGGTVAVSVREQDESVVVEVADTGIGIAPDHQSRVFERFYRVDKARSRDRGGTGLGLSIVKHLTSAFGGSVHLESSIGKGSTFRVRLPRSSQQDRE